MHRRRHLAVLVVLAGAAGCLRRPARAPDLAPDPRLLRADGWACTLLNGSLPLPPGVAFARGRAVFASLRIAAAADSAGGRLVVAGPTAPGAPEGEDVPGLRAARVYFAVAFAAADDTTGGAGRPPSTRFVNEVGATGAERLPRPVANRVYAASERLGERFWAAMGYPAAACHSPGLRPAPPPAPSTTARPPATVADGKADRAAVRRGPGWVLEATGLRDWTLAQLEDSLTRHAPGLTLASAACAAVLRYRLGFADAAVVTYVGVPGDSASHVVLMVAEPGDSARVRHRRAPLDTLGAYAPWRTGRAALATGDFTFAAAAAAYPRWRRAPAAPDVAALGRDPATARVWRFLAAHATPADARAARALLDTSPDYRTRAVAAAVLATALSEDTTVHALVGALRQSDGPARGVASAVLGALADAPGRRVVGWAPAAGDVHALLDGTSPFYAAQLFRVLVATGAGPADARGFVRGGGTFLLDALGAEQPALRANARALLIALRGMDLGAAPGPWRAWIRAL